FGTPIAPAKVCSWLAQVAEALDYCNSQHHFDGQRVAIQHCDVKPSNFLLFGHTVKLSDFGLASLLSSPWKGHRQAGTPDYRSHAGCGQAATCLKRQRSKQSSGAGAAGLWTS